MDADRLKARLEGLERRVAHLEERLAEVDASGPAEEGTESVAATVPGAGKLSGHVVPLLGRTLVVLGGAFVLRAVTEAGLLHQATGAGIGILYALTWFVLADRAAGNARTPSALFHVIAAALIAFPLIWETTAKFGYLTPVTSALLLVLVVAVALAVGMRHGLQRTAALVMFIAVLTASGLAVATRALLPFGVCLLAFTAAAFSLSSSRRWLSLAWAAGLPILFAFTVMALLPPLSDPERLAALISPLALMALLLGLVVASVGSLMADTLTGHDLTWGQVVLGGLAAMVGMGGSLAATQVTGEGGMLLGAVCLVAAGGCYLTAFFFLDEGRGRLNYAFYATVALVCTLVSLQALLSPATRVYGFALAAVALAWNGARRNRATLSGHGALYAAAAALAAALPAGVVAALLGDATSPWPGAPEIVAVAAAVGCCAFPIARHGRTWGRLTAVPRIVALAIVAAGGSALLIRTAAGWLPDGDAGALAALRTGVIAAAAMLAAWLGRFDRVREALWFAYPLLIAGGIKLLAQDVPAGRPATLVLSFALYGGALILVPRLIHGTHESPGPAE